MKRKTVFIITSACVCLTFALLLNMQVTTKQGVNYKLYIKKIPLYFKVIGFVYRDLAYKQLIKEIIKDQSASKEKKVLAIFKWTRQNIRRVPDGFPVVDDHILNIIIRGYGANDQSQDVFCMLCEYAGIPAAWVFISPERTVGQERSIPAIAVSLVKLDDEWKVFDPYFGSYFLNEDGEFASVKEIIAAPHLLDQLKHNPVLEGVEYKRYFNGLNYISDKELWKRGKTQMPVYRLFYETKKLLKLQR